MNQRSFPGPSVRIIPACADSNKRARGRTSYHQPFLDFQLQRNTSKTQRNMYRWVWRIVSPRRAGEAGPRARGGSDAEEEGAVREGLLEARETRAAGHREDARQGEGVPRGRPGDRPRAVDGRRRGGEAPARAADAELPGARRGIDETEATAAAEIAAIRDGPRRGLSPGQIAATRPELGLAASTICRRVDAGYDGTANMEPRRKVGYGPRRKSAPAGAGRRSARGSHAAFGALPGDGRAGAWEMDAVAGRTRAPSWTRSVWSCSSPPGST